MPTVTIVGLGPGPLDQVTKEVEARLLAADRVLFRTGSYPAYGWLKSLGKEVISFDALYKQSWPDSRTMYEFMVSAVLKEATLRGQATYALPGSPWILEDTTQMLLKRGPVEGVQIEVLEGMSFIEPALARIGRRFDNGLQIVMPRMHLEPGHFDKRVPMLVCQIDARKGPGDVEHVDLTVQWLLAAYPPDHEVTLIWTPGLPDYPTHSMTLRLEELAEVYGHGRHYSSLFVPPAPATNA